MRILPKVDLLRSRANQSLDPKRKSALGQFFTPAPICRFMASLFSKLDGDIKLLDPGCGVGPLCAAVVEEAISRNALSSFSITGYELEPLIKPYFEETVNICRQAVPADIPFSADFRQEDFILKATEVLAGQLKNGQEGEGYTHVIMNPPYKKIGSSSEHRKTLRRLGIESVNLYTGFFALAVKLLKPGGEIVGIIPRSFCNGPYYLPFRKALLAETAIKHIHIFDSRHTAFSGDDVLQENIIIHCIKGAAAGQVTITASPGADFNLDTESRKVAATGMSSRRVGLDRIVKPTDHQQFIHITPTQGEQAIVDRLSCFNFTLKDLNLSVSTGPVVDFRLKEELREDFSPGTAPLLYPLHLNKGVSWPKKSRKPNAIMISEKSKPWLWKQGDFFVLTRRFSSKEEKRRIVATVYDSSLPGEMIGFDNKLNVFHRNKEGVGEELAKGLYVYLNSTLIDRYYRQFGGHTQVNATDLKNLHYPDLAVLLRLGAEAKQVEQLSQEEIDQLVDREIELMRS